MQINENTSSPTRHPLHPHNTHIPPNSSQSLSYNLTISPVASAIMGLTVLHGVRDTLIDLKNLADASYDGVDTSHPPPVHSMAGNLVRKKCVKFIHVTLHWLALKCLNFTHKTLKGLWIFGGLPPHYSHPFSLVEPLLSLLFLAERIWIIIKLTLV